MLIKNFSLATLCLVVFTASSLHATVKLPKIFSDNMVLQRDRTLSVWGWADKSENITVKFNGQQLKAKADQHGLWRVSLKPMKHGGPYEMQISGKTNSVTLKNILIGDVWLGSGQSNMEWILKNTNDAEKEIAEANYPKIRLFTVEKATSFKPKTDLEGGQWLACTPQTVGDFSAVAYYFGKKLQEELSIPIGLINISWGGTNIETWISWDVMSKEDAFRNVDLEEQEKKAAESEKKRSLYLEALKNDKGLSERWFEPAVVKEGWKKIPLPQEWSSTEIGNTDGIVWFKKEFDVPAPINEKEWTLSLGPIDDEDHTYVNGVLVGSVNAWNKERIYTLRPGVVKPGKNLVVVKVTDYQGGGGIYGKPDQLYLENDGKKISLQGDWEYKPSVLTSDFGIHNWGPNSFPSQLYNAMIAPIVQYAIRGVIWYQGESNTWAAYRYRKLFPGLIANWRNKWNHELPFFWAQLANFMSPSEKPSDSEWAELREAQSMTLSVPKTGQAVIIDIGEEHDIHPRNKKDVGTRLALAALKVDYEKDIVYSGPVLKSMEVEENKVVLSFSNIGSGLIAKNDKYGYLYGFAIAGEDQKFVWARGYILDDKVIVYHEDVPKPVAVRYAWGNNPDDANLFNKEGQPASPFRTDTWKGITEGR